MGKKKKLVIAAVATVAGAAGVGVLLRKSGAKKASGPALYRGSHKSKTLHQSGCRYYDSKKLTRVFQNLDAAVESGYKPCKVCMS